MPFRDLLLLQQLAEPPREDIDRLLRRPDRSAPRLAEKPARCVLKEVRRLKQGRPRFRELDAIHPPLDHPLELSLVKSTLAGRGEERRLDSRGCSDVLGELSKELYV